jgi:gluconate 2-dehydrogenase gamma chain
MAGDERSRKISRRDLLRGAGMAGAAAVFPGALQGLAEGEGEILPGDAPGRALLASPPSRGTLAGNLTVEEAEILDAMIARLIPADDLGPGAREAGAIDFIDRELGGALAGSREAYRSGLAALDAYAQTSKGGPFSGLSEADQDALLMDVQSGDADGATPGFEGSSASFFNMVRGHTWQATFGDPYYGGNREHIGWRLIGYPGARVAVSAEDQRRLEAGELPLLERSAYD